MTVSPNHIVRCRVANLELIGESLIQVNLKDEAIIGIKDLLEIFNSGRTLANEKPYALLIITGTYNDITPGLRLFKGLANTNNIIAEARVVNSLPTRIAVNFLYKWIRPQHPVKTFTSKEKARNWLRDMTQPYETDFNNQCVNPT